MLVPSFAEEKALTLDDLREKAIDYSPKIREIKSTESTVKEQIRKNIQNSYALANALDHYYDYLHLYNENVRDSDKYAKYIGRSDEYLIAAIGYVNPATGDAQGLYKKYVYAQATGNEKLMASIEEEMTFINLLMFFGPDPSLSLADKYSNFKRDEEMLKNSEEYILTKYNEGIEFATNSVDSAIVGLYLNLANAEKALSLKEELLEINELALNNLETSYNLGASSKIDYENQKYETEKVRLDTENFKLTISTLNFALRKNCNLELTKDYPIDTNIDNSNFVLSNDRSDYYEMAYTNNYDYITTKSEYDLNMKNFKVMDKYLPDEDENDAPQYYKEKDDLKTTLEDLEDKLFNIKSNMMENVNYACNDLILKKEQIENARLSLEENQSTKDSAELMYKQGQINVVTRDKGLLGYYNAKFNYEKSIRDYNIAVEKFKLLTNNGIVYE